MRFILEDINSITKFDGSQLRDAYQDREGVDLSVKPSFLGKPAFIGGTDVETRRSQVEFLEKIRTIIDNFLGPQSTVNQKLCAYKVMIAACLYVQEQIATKYTVRSPEKNSDLSLLINQFLGITKENYMDTEDRDDYFHIAHHITKRRNVFTELNKLLEKSGQKEFTKKEWEDFSNFIEEKEADRKKREAAAKEVCRYPVISTVQPAFEALFDSVGRSVGWVLGEAVSTSAHVTGARLSLTSAISGAFLAIGSGGTAGAFIAPALAASLISSFCTLNLTKLSGSAFRLVGKGTGVVVGLPFDLAYKLLVGAGALIVGNTKGVELAGLTGLRLTDGAMVIGGQVMVLREVSKEELAVVKKAPLQITSAGVLKGGESVKDSAGLNKTIQAVQAIQGTSKKVEPIIEEPDDEAVERKEVVEVEEDGVEVTVLEDADTDNSFALL